MRCHIRIKGLLDPSWQSWFGGLEIVQEQEGTTLFVGPLEDQAALHGILAKFVASAWICSRLKPARLFHLRNAVNRAETISLWMVRAALGPQPCVAGSSLFPLFLSLFPLIVCLA